MNRDQLMRTLDTRLATLRVRVDLRMAQIVADDGAGVALAGEALQDAAIELVARTKLAMKIAKTEDGSGTREELEVREELLERADDVAFHALVMSTMLAETCNIVAKKGVAP